MYVTNPCNFTFFYFVFVVSKGQHGDTVTPGDRSFSNECREGNISYGVIFQVRLVNILKLRFDNFLTGP